MSNNIDFTTELKELKEKVEILENKMNELTEKDGTIDLLVTAANRSNNILKFLGVEVGKNNAMWLAVNCNFVVHGSSWLQGNVTVDGSIKSNIT